MKEQEFILKKGIFGKTSGHLILNNNFLELEQKQLLKSAYSSFSKEDITGLRYGIRWIRFYLLIGRKYQIYLRGKDRKTIKIIFGSYFGKDIQLLHKMYSEIIEAFYECYFDEIINSFIQKFHEGEEFEIEGLMFTEEGLTFTVDNSLGRNKKVFIPWENIRTNNYATYFAVYSVTDKTNLYKAFSYQNDWNTAIIFSVLRTILRNKEIEVYT